MITRRRMIAVSAVALGSLALPGAGLGSAAAYRWRGHALGGGASLILYDADAERARATVETCVAEIERLEDEFSLYRASSALRRLNRDGRLDAASLDMRDLLALARRVAEKTGGAFDITVQPLWELYARTPSPDTASLAAAEERVNYRDIAVDGATVRFTRPGMAATLNGVAQGYITDRVADLLAAAGYVNVLIDLGEIRALGPKAGGAAWRIALPGGERHALVQGAVATSAPGEVGNLLLDPRSGRPAPRHRSVSVFAPGAAEADALSTAFSLMAADDIEAVLAGGSATAVVRERTGTRVITGDRRETR